MMKHSVGLYSDYAVNLAASKFRFLLHDLHKIPHGSVDGFHSPGTASSNGGHMHAKLTGYSKSIM